MARGYFTIGELSELYGLPAWQIRRAVDSLGEEIPRAGLYRLIATTILPRLEEELRRRGWLAEEVHVS